MNYFLSQVVGELLIGITGSFIFLFAVLFLMRPSVRIGEVIVRQVNIYDTETTHTYFFKIINKSWFDAYDVQLELFEVDFYPANPKGFHKRLTDIPLKRNQLKQIPACKRIKIGAMFADHCVSFRTNIDLREILSNEYKALLLQVTLKHGISGLSGIHSRDYRGISCIKNGNFKFGDSFEIIQ